MIHKLTGSQFTEMLRHGVHNLAKHASVVNDLNVFPVPDGDTGTNMVLTMKNGLHAIHEGTETVARAAHEFALATVFGARGNSGVIVSQFFRGISDGLSNLRDADCAAFIEALDRGCDYAYAAVAKPVEGTILTVLREATDAVRARAADFHSIDAVIDTFLREARISLDNTPNLLPILQKAGVVDSGGSGIVYFFEGVQRYLRGDEPEDVIEVEAEAPAPTDYSRFHKNSDFSLGYCTEVLIQLTVDDFDYAAFARGLESIGDSVVSSLEGDKVKVHVHTPTPEKALAFCHNFGEFLSLKIENMSVQHTEEQKKLLRADREESGAFAVVAVAPGAHTQALLAEMGADVVILGEDAPSSMEFLEAFRLTGAPRIAVFPGSANSVLAATHAGEMYEEGQVKVLNCPSFAGCYAALSVLDFNEESLDAVSGTVDSVLANLTEVSVVRADRSVRFGDRAVAEGEFFAMADKDILLTRPSRADAVLAAADAVLAARDCDVITLFYGRDVTEDEAEAMSEALEAAHGGVEVCLLSTKAPIYDAVLLFE